ncbi:hypothetical protein D3C73_1004340 [compost metagenome]
MRVLGEVLADWLLILSSSIGINSINRNYTRTESIRRLHHSFAHRQQLGAHFVVRHRRTVKNNICTLRSLVNILRLEHIPRLEAKSSRIAQFRSELLQLRQSSSKRHCADASLQQFCNNNRSSSSGCA